MKITKPPLIGVASLLAIATFFIHPILPVIIILLIAALD